jgi:hypothetical protein
VRAPAALAGASSARAPAPASSPAPTPPRREPFTASAAVEADAWLLSLTDAPVGGSATTADALWDDVLCNDGGGGGYLDDLLGDVMRGHAAASRPSKDPGDRTDAEVEALRLRVHAQLARGGPPPAAATAAVSAAPRKQPSRRPLVVFEDDADALWFGD